MAAADLRNCRDWKLWAIDPYDRHTWRSCMRSTMHAASQLPRRGPLMWMLPLYLQVNHKSDDPDDDDEQHHWYIVKMLNHRFNNVLHNIAFLTSLQEPIRYCLNNVSSDHFWLMCRYRGNIHTPSRKLVCCEHCKSIQDLQVCLSWELQISTIPLCHLLSCHLGPPRLMHQPVCQRLSCLHHWSIPHVHTSRAISPPEWSTDPQWKPAQVTHWIWWWQCLAAWHCISVWSLPCQFVADIGSLALSMAKSYRHGALRSSHNTCTHSHVSWKRAGGKSPPVATPWNFFQVVFTCVVIQSSQPSAAESMSPR